MAEVIIFWLLFPIMSFPHLMILLLNKAKLTEDIFAKEEDEEEEGEEDEEENIEAKGISAINPPVEVAISV